jgi:hypothetical protein
LATEGSPSSEGLFLPLGGAKSDPIRSLPYKQRRDRNCTVCDARRVQRQLTFGAHQILL